MIPPRSTSLLGLAALALSLFAPGPAAQACPDPGDAFWKNDSLPQIVGGTVTVGVVAGLCENEAAGAIFAIPPGLSVQKLTKVAVGFGSQGGGSGAVALVNVEIYDGAAPVPGTSKYTLGPKVFDLGVDQASDMQVTSTGVNELDVSNFGIEVGHSGMGNFVVVFRMLFNPNGSCAGGFTSNFMTADPYACPQVGKNLIDISGAGAAPDGGPGWHDVSTVTFLFGLVKMCPAYVAGDWVIRACSEDLAPAGSLSGGPPTLSLSTGGTQNWFLDAGPSNGNHLYIVLGSASGTAGFPIGGVVLPLTVPDPLGYFDFSLQYPNAPPYSNSFGLLDLAGKGSGSITLGAGINPSLAGLTFHHAFATISLLSGSITFASNALPLTFTL